MVILRQGFRRISRCPLGVVKLCLSLFLGLYQFIMRRNDQNKPEVVEHDYFEGETSFDSMWQNRFDLSWISVIFLIILLNLTLPTKYRHFSTYQSLLANNGTVNFLCIISYFYFISEPFRARCTYRQFMASTNVLSWRWGCKARAGAPHPSRLVLSVSRLLPRLRIRVSIASLFVSMAAAWEKRVPKRYSDEIFSTGLLFRKKTRTINDRNRLYPVVVTAVNKVEKWVKIHYVGYSEQFDE